MDGTNGVAMDIDCDDGSSDNIIEGQAKKVNLSEMPNEILEQILIHLGDESLLAVSHVCKSFASVAATAFARKYSNQYYIIGGDDLFEKVMLTKYGEKIRRIEIDHCHDEEILGLVEQKCHNLEVVELSYLPKLIILNDLREAHIYLTDVTNETFAEFISHNQQLEVLQINLDEYNPDLEAIDLLDGQLDNLKKLRYIRDDDDALTLSSPKIRLNSLETLEAVLTRNEHHAQLLRALECDQLKHLEWSNYDEPDDNNEATNAVCKFKTLVSLKLPLFPVTEVQLKKLAAHLPHLTELSFRTTEKKTNAIVNNILTVLSIFPKLSKISISLYSEEFLQFLSDFEKSINEFHGYFVGTNAEVEIIHFDDDHYEDGSMVSISEDFVIISKKDQCESYGLELHWMENLNEKNVREAMARVRNDTSKLKFINHCAGSTLDICAFLPKLGQINSLDIKSDGPITFKANSSRHHNFFPRLKILKLHLDEHNVIDFLQKLDSTFGKRIQELCLDTKGGAPRDQGRKDANDMMKILKKFKNLKSMHLASVFANFNNKRASTVFKKVKDLRVQFK